MDKTIHEQLRRQGKEALEQMQHWPERMKRNLPPDWTQPTQKVQPQKADVNR